MLCRSTGRAAAVAVLAAVLCVAALAAPPAAAEAAVPNSAARTAPPFEQFFAQSFQVSVMTQSSGVFNATLRMRASPNFPERVQGELIPIGEAKLNSKRQTLLPHFQRARSLEDDKLSALSFSMAAGFGRLNRKKKGGTDESRSGQFAVAGKEERPSLLMVDLHLRHTDAMQGTASVYYLPADLMALRAQREGIKEGSAPPSATVEFEFRSESDHMTGNPLSDVQALAHVSSAVVTMRGQSGASKSSNVAGEKADDGSAAAARQGGIIFRWITEHEFSAHVTIPITDKTGATSTHMEQIWVYGYATPSKSVFDRKQREVPLHNRYMMIGVGLLGFFVQVVSGITEGKRRAQEAVNVEAKAQGREKAKLEAPLLEQERNSKKKK